MLSDIIINLLNFWWHLIVGSLWPGDIFYTISLPCLRNNLAITLCKLLEITSILIFLVGLLMLHLPHISRHLLNHLLLLNQRRDRSALLMINDHFIRIAGISYASWIIRAVPIHIVYAVLVANDHHLVGAAGREDGGAGAVLVECRRVGLLVHH